MDPRSIIIFILLIKGNLSLGEDKCADYAKDIDFHHPTISYTSPDPTGVWVSSRCEIVPNPKYIIRRLDIQSSKWTSNIYHYSDSWCTKPTFEVKIVGSYEMLPATATPNSKASYASLFHFRSIYFNSNSAKVIEDIITLILEKCPSALPSISSMQKDNILYLDKYVNKDISLDVNAVLSKKHCRYYFVVHPGSYRKIRMTGESIGTPAKISSDHDKLYFGSILPFHSNKQQIDISSKFQYALSRLNRPGCGTCETVSKVENPNIPPILKLPKGRKDFSGGWVTETCEATDDKTFESTFYKFSYTGRRTDRGVFVSENNFFSDTNCKVKKFNMKAGGSFNNIVVTKGIRGVYEVMLTFKWLSLTIYDDATMSLVRNGGSLCGDSSKWRIGAEQNLTKSNGCKLLGFEIPTSLKTIVRISKTKSSQTFYITPVEEKGTFFFSNFVSCNIVTKRVSTTPPTPKTNVIPVDTNFDLNKINNRKSGVSRIVQSTLVQLILSTLFILFYFC